VVITGGDGSGATSTGGDVIIQAGTGSDAAKRGIISLRDGAGNEVINVAADGDVTLSTPVTVDLRTTFNAGVVFGATTTKTPAATINIDTDTDTVVVVSNAAGGGTANALTDGGTPADGQLLVVINLDDDATSGIAAVPAGETRWLIHISGTWYGV